MAWGLRGPEHKPRPPEWGGSAHALAPKAPVLPCHGLPLGFFDMIESCSPTSGRRPDSRMTLNRPGRRAIVIPESWKRQSSIQRRTCVPAGPWLGAVERKWMCKRRRQVTNFLGAYRLMFSRGTNRTSEGRKEVGCIRCREVRISALLRRYFLGLLFPAFG